MLKKISDSKAITNDFINFKSTPTGNRDSNASPELLFKLINFPLIKEKEGFVFYHENEIVFRLFVHTDENLKKGFFSLFNCNEKLLKSHFSLVKNAFIEIENFFKERDISHIYGPYFYSSFLPYRFRVDADELSYNWEPKQPSSEYEIFKDLGFQDSETYFSNFSNNFSPWDQNGIKERKKLLEEGFSFRYISRDSIDDDIQEIYRLSIISFKDNHLFKEIPFEVFKELYIPNLINYDLSLAHLTIDPKGKIAAFHFNFKDQDQVVLKSICVHPDYRGRGIFQAGINESIEKAKKLYPEVKRATAALVHDENEACKHVALRGGGTSLHIYKLVTKEL